MRFDINSDFQTMQALLLSHLIKNTVIDDDTLHTLYDDWEEMYEASSFFVGESDDLTLRDYVQAMEVVYGDNPSYEELESISNLEVYRSELRKLDRAKILGTVGSKESTSGLRFFGQRFSIDGWIHNSLSHPEVESRYMVKGLDIPASLGSSVAERYLGEELDAFSTYKDELETVRASASEILDSEGDRNLYASSFKSLATLLVFPQQGVLDL